MRMKRVVEDILPIFKFWVVSGSNCQSLPPCCFNHLYFMVPMLEATEPETVAVVSCRQTYCGAEMEFEDMEVLIITARLSDAAHWYLSVTVAVRVAGADHRMSILSGWLGKEAMTAFGALQLTRASVGVGVMRYSDALSVSHTWDRPEIPTSGSVIANSATTVSAPAIRVTL